MKFSGLLSTILILLSINGLKAQTGNISVKLIGGYNVAMKQNAEKNISALLNEFNKTYNADASLNYNNIKITEEAKKNINSMWQFNEFYCPQSSISETLSKGLQNYELRNIPVLLKDDSGTKQQEIAIEVNEQGEITDLYFSLQQFQYKNIMSTGNNVVEETQLNIIRNFLENMKTSYMRKDIDFINNIFSDKALIIVGKKIQQTERQSLDLTATRKEHLFDKNSTQFKKLTKEQYLNNLKSVFQRNKSISVNFEDIEIVRHKKRGYESYYGIRLKQDWYSDNYSDQGLLFFVIEFREDDNPLIWVRVWQDPDTDASQQIGLGEIKINPTKKEND